MLIGFATAFHRRVSTFASPSRCGTRQLTSTSPKSWTFGAKGFAYIYYSKTVGGKKMLPRSEFARFVGMESDTRLIRVYVPSSQRIRILRRADFHPITDNLLPSVTSLLDGISRQRAIEAGTTAEPDLEEALQATAANLDLLNDLKHVSGNFSAQSSVMSVLKPHKNYMGISDGPPLPRSFDEACRIPHWAEAIDREYNAHIRNNTWKYVKLTPDMKPVPFKWAFRAKAVNADRMMYLYKARCNLRGDLQEAGVDFDPDALYAPVAGHESILLLFNYSAAEGLDVEGCDVDNAYVNGFIDIPVIMEQPTDSSRRLAMPGYVCLLVKSLYGARQSGRIWGNVLHEKLTKWGFQPSTVDPRLYFFRQQTGYILLCVVVDDIAFASNNTRLLTQFKEQMQASFQVKLYGRLKSFIRWSIDRSLSGIFIHQRDYALRLLARFGMSKCNAVYTPLSSTADLTDRRGDEPELSRETHHLYRAIIGGLAYLSSCTRPDITYAVSLLSRHLHNPSFRHLQAAKRLLRYVAGTVGYGLKYRANIPTKLDVSLGAYVDADWGGDKSSRKSTTGFIVNVNGAPIYWRSKRQQLVTLSSGEAEYVAMSACAKEVTWLRRLFWEVTQRQPWTNNSNLPPTHIRYIAPTVICSDSSAAISMATRDSASTRTRHVDIRYHHIKDLIARKVITLYKVGTKDQMADVLTKATSMEVLDVFRRALMHSAPPTTSN